MIYFPSLQATDDPILLDLRVGTLLEEEEEEHACEVLDKQVRRPNISLAGSA